jgi:hypothetical protein
MLAAPGPEVDQRQQDHRHTESQIGDDVYGEGRRQHPRADAHDDQRERQTGECGEGEIGPSAVGCPWAGQIRFAA